MYLDKLQQEILKLKNRNDLWADAPYVPSSRLRMFEFVVSPMVTLISPNHLRPIEPRNNPNPEPIISLSLLLLWNP